MLARVVEGVQLGRVEEDAARDVGGEGVVLVGVPQAAGDLDELQGAAVAGGVVEVFVEPEVLRGAGVEAGHDVPAGPAAADVVERGEAAGEVEGRVVGRTGGAHQADVPGVGGHGGEEGEGFEAVEVVRRVGGVDELAVDDEQGVEQGVFGGLGEADVVVDVDAGVLRDPGVLPQTVLAGAADAVGVEGEVEGAGHGWSCSVVAGAVLGGSDVQQGS